MNRSGILAFPICIICNIKSKFHFKHFWFILKMNIRNLVRNSQVAFTGKRVNPNIFKFIVYFRSCLVNTFI